MKRVLISLGVSFVAVLAVVYFVLLKPETLNNTDLSPNTEFVAVETQSTEAETELIEEPEPQTINLVMVGDMLMHTRVLDSGDNGDGTYDFTHLFTYVSEKVHSADVALVNSETILGGRELGISSYPCFNSPYEVGIAEVKAGFDVVLGASNHALDKGWQGVKNCVAFWEDTYPGMALIGMYDDQESSEEIYVFEKNGIRIAILNYTYGTNGIPMPNSYCVNWLEEESVRQDIARAHELADFVVVCPHWGEEYQLTANRMQKNWCQIFLECGVDLVIGTHPHVIEPIEWYEDENGNRMLVYYSLGNFVNGTESVGSGISVRMVGGMADVTIGRDENGLVSIWDYDVHPLVCHEGPGSEYTVYYLEDYTEDLAAANWIVDSDSMFSLQFCKDIVKQVWDLDY